MDPVSHIDAASTFLAICLALGATACWVARAQAFKESYDTTGAPLPLAALCLTIAACISAVVGILTYTPGAA